MSGNDRRLIIWGMKSNRIRWPSTAVTNLQPENILVMSYVFSFVFRLAMLLKHFCFPNYLGIHTRSHRKQSGWFRTGIIACRLYNVINLKWMRMFLVKEMTRRLEVGMKWKETCSAQFSKLKLIIHNLKLSLHCTHEAWKLTSIQLYIHPPPPDKSSWRSA
jgi:hypothetical protein